MKDCTTHPNYIAAKKKAGETRKNKYYDKYYNNPKFCKFCNKEISYKRRYNNFCNRSCAAKYNNKDRIIATDVEKFCLKCNTKLNRTSKNQRKFCSVKCCNEYRKKTTDKKFKIKFKNGELNRLTKTGNTPYKQRIKNLITELNGDRCSICSMPAEWEFKSIVLILDHIDGNSENNELTNLRLVCPNCDSQLSTFKGRNTGNGRHSRRQRYKEGKSY